MKSSKTPWQGTDYIEKRVNSVRNALVYVYLDGVDGVSPYRGRNQVSVADADRYLANGHEVLAWMEAQRPAPIASARRWMQHKIQELARLVQQAEAVRGGAPQKMTEEDYENTRKSLGVSRSPASRHNGAGIRLARHAQMSPTRGRRALEKAAWKATHKDYRSNFKGGSVLMLLEGRTALVPLKSLKPEALRKYARSVGVSA